MENQELIKQVTERAQQWLTPAYDAETQAEVKRMLDNPDKTELIECFYRDLEFGTGGLRGIMGAGTNRMNIYVVGAATQGFANYLKKNFKNREQISVAIGYDCRNNSDLFAKKSADIFSANGIKVYLFDDMRPTPEMSFAIRYLGCQAGINITASHNPREYNGYKAYWEDGAQVLAPHDKGIIDEVGKVKVEDIKFEGNPDLIEIIGAEIDKIYWDQVHTICIDPDVIKRQKDLSIVYTPLHGTGMNGIPQSLKLWGFENVHCVPEQMVKSGDFPTVVSPNPENAEALTLAIKLAKEIDADIVMASDPDADRVGMACKNDKGEWVLINGNQTCLLFLYYIITNRKKLGKMVGNEFVVNIKDKKVGWIKEGMDFITDDKVPAEVMALRGRSTLESDNAFLEEKIILYRKKVEVDQDFLKNHYNYDFKGINDIMRYHINFLTKKMDNPESLVHCLDEEHRVHTLKADRVYTLFFVLQFKWAEQVEYKSFRVVVNRNGILEINPR